MSEETRSQTPIGRTDQPLVEKGTPSKSLQDAIAKGEERGIGVLDAEPEFERLTDANPEQGIFPLLGGYLDDDGKLHRTIHFRAMTGNEEDLLGNDGVDFSERLVSIIASCAVKIGPIEDRATINRAIHNVPSGALTWLMCCVRMVSHWETEKDVVSMELECPMRRCKHLGTYRLPLMLQDLYESPTPEVRTFKTTLPKTKSVIEWELMSSKWDSPMRLIDRAFKGKRPTINLVTRLISWDGEHVQVSPEDFLTADRKKINSRLPGKLVKLIKRVGDLPVVDRETLRGQFEVHEPGIDMEFDVECESCNHEWKEQLNPASTSFFFPQVTSQRSRRRRSI